MHFLDVLHWYEIILLNLFLLFSRMIIGIWSIWKIWSLVITKRGSFHHCYLRMLGYFYLWNLAIWIIMFLIIFVIRGLIGYHNLKYGILAICIIPATIIRSSTMKSRYKVAIIYLLIIIMIFKFLLCYCLPTDKWLLYNCRTTSFLSMFSKIALIIP